MTVSWLTPAHAPPQPDHGKFIVTRYADILALLRHPDIVAWELWLDIQRLGHRAGRDYSALTDLLRTMLPNQNGEEHAKARSVGRQALLLLAPAFAPERVAKMIDEHLRAARAAGRVEAMESLCRAIPTAVMTAALGLSPSCMSAIRRASIRIFAVYDPGLSVRLLDSIDEEARAAQSELMGDLERARRDPGMGLSRLLTFIDAGFDTRALTGLIFFLVLAGIETVTGLLGSMTLLLLQFPDQWQRLVADPGLGSRCAEEAIRFAGPVRWLAPRIARQPVMLGGVNLPAGAIIMPELEQAHHDPEAFAQPDKFDIMREGPPHMGFAIGAHACLGASLGRLQARTFLQALLHAGPIAGAQDPLWEKHSMFRRLTRLELQFT
jgi:cytochrome P450